MSQIDLLNQSPMVFRDRDFIYHELINEVNKEISRLNPNPFEFEAINRKVVEKYRYIFPTKKVMENSIIRGYVKKIAAYKIPIFLKELRMAINAHDYIVTDLDWLKYTLRVRIYEDRKGYSLQPHKDSMDTLFSFILHLDATNPKTNIYNRSGLGATVLPIGADDETARAILRKIINQDNKSAEIQWGESQFHNHPCAWSSDGKCYRYDRKDGSLVVVRYEESQLSGEFGDLFGIHNVQKGRFPFESYIKNNESAYHGVRPTKLEKRRLMILDLIAQAKPDQAMLNLEGVGESEDTFYVIYREETCKALNQILK